VHRVNFEGNWPTGREDQFNHLVAALLPCFFLSNGFSVAVFGASAIFVSADKVFETFLGFHRVDLGFYCGNRFLTSWSTCRESWIVQRIRFRRALPPFFSSFFLENFQGLFLWVGTWELHFAAAIHGEAAADVLPDSVCDLERGEKSYVCFRFCPFSVATQRCPGVDIFDVFGRHLPTPLDFTNVVAVLPVHLVSREELGARCSW